MSLACVSGFFNFVPSFTLTLPGIAGVILSIGMGVDANIITNERIKEELRAGKTLDGAIRTGSKTSFAAIFDGNITVIIVAVILMLVFGPSNILSGIFGASTTGTIYSFGYTLLVGVIGNFLMGVTASRLMLSSLSGYKFMRKKFLVWRWRRMKFHQFKIRFVENKKIFFGISIAVLLIGVIFNVIFGARLDIQFTGGAIVNYSFTGEINTDELAALVEETTGKSVNVNESTDIVAGEDGTINNNVSIEFAGNDALSLEGQKAMEDAIQEKLSG